jgi:hypothetical protein
VSSQNSPTLELDVRARRWEPRIAAITLLLAAASPWALGGISFWVMAAGSTIFTVVVWWGLRRACWLGGARRIERVVWLPDGHWVLVDGQGRSRDGMLRADSRTGGQIVWLRWNADGIRSMLLASGDVPATELRRLVVRLRVAGGQAAPDPVPLA